MKTSVIVGSVDKTSSIFWLIFPSGSSRSLPAASNAIRQYSKDLPGTGLIGIYE
jgi:hypothetical protein